MSDSSSSLSTSTPSDSSLEKALRDAVRHVYETGRLENLTVKRVRKVAEERLDLEEDYFKNNSSWKEKSKTIIQSEVVCKIPWCIDPAHRCQEAHADPTSSQVSLQKETGPKLSKQKAKSQSSGKKSAVNTQPGGAKRRKAASNEDSSGAPEERERSAEKIDEPISKSAKAGAEGSESEMSEVLDEAPKARRKRRSSGPERDVSKKSKTSKVAKVEQPTDPDAEEIKRLQGWLVKCGTRKVWGKELQPYDTSKGKIRHLKDMLADVGMTGRYSAEKAAQIKEERELKADLEAVQAGNKQWGMVESMDGDGDKPKRRLAKGLQELDFLNDDDGEESD